MQLAQIFFFQFKKPYMDAHSPNILVIMEIRVNLMKLLKTFTLLGFEGFLCSVGRRYFDSIVVA